LLQKDRWKGADRDCLQHAEAVKLGLECIRFRDPDMDLKKVEKSDPSHFRFLTSDPEICVRQFEQFKKDVLFKLDNLWERLHVPPSPPRRQLPRLVRVVIRSRNADVLWTKLFPSLDAQPDIIHDTVQYDPNRTPLSVKHRTKPCQGFLLLCDISALEDPSLSPHGALEECQEIQLASKEPTRCPPVGIIYWPPPADPWPRLLQNRPAKLFRVSGDDLAGLRAFIHAVKEVVP
jgi:hypothetical protein